MPLHFQLHQLGWFSFEQLCRTTCRAVWGQPVEAYSLGPDGGRDGFFIGEWTSESGSDPVVIQCKHSTTPDKAIALTLALFEEELPKVKVHVDEGRCHRYILMTNMKVSGDVAASIETELKAVGVVDPIVLGYEGICEMVQEEKRLRALVPRLYSLGDLSEILDERAYLQAEAVLATMHDLARLVPVEAHRKAHDALRDQRFALLIGPPGSGKTSIAASLAVGAVDLYGTRTIRLTHPSEFMDKWNPNDPDQLFWLDDAFGANQYDERSATEWNQT